MIEPNQKAYFYGDALDGSMMIIRGNIREYTLQAKTASVDESVYGMHNQDPCFRTVVYQRTDERFQDGWIWRPKKPSVRVG